MLRLGDGIKLHQKQQNKKNKKRGNESTKYVNTWLYDA
jgi:hypothetical protein